MKKNKKLMLIVASLLVVIGVSFSYFLATTLINGKGSSVVGTTARIKGAEINIEGTLEFNDTDVYPGHKNVSAIKVTATGSNQLIPYNLIWKGESGISQINYTVYKNSAPKALSTNCERKTGVQNGMQVLSEECTITNIDTLGEAIASGSISKGDTKEILAQDEFITALNNGSTVYYYVVLEYPNLDEDQSSDANATFNGEVTVEESNKEADINILAVYVADDSGNYQETTDIPQSGYGLNSSKSTCSNNSQPIWDSVNKGVIVSNLTKSGTSCYLYFDKLSLSAQTLANLRITPNNTKPDFSQIATTDEGVFKIEDGMYGDYSYYWRGAATNNHVIFANICWRIVRINGDGTMRLIYNGAPSGIASNQTCPDNGSNSSSVVMGSTNNERYYATNDGKSNNSSYVGWTYTLGSQRPSDNATGTESNIKVQTEKWYKANITDTGYDDKVAEGLFCNDRNTGVASLSWGGGYTTTWSATGIQFAYAGVDRLYNKYVPILGCSNITDENDIYKLKVGAITADEVELAGGKNEGNTSYYLYNGLKYWTMSPFSWDNGDGAQVFFVTTDGSLGGYYVHCVRDTAFGIRPVINLKADVTISSGNGTLDTPFVVD